MLDGVQIICFKARNFKLAITRRNVVFYLILYLSFFSHIVSGLDYSLYRRMNWKVCVRKRHNVPLFVGRD
jgi:hypothetical protein